MTRHMVLNNDVLGRIHTILNQDDYFRTHKELPVINGLHEYDDIQLFPKLFDTSAVIERITSEADLIENNSGVVCTHFHRLLCHVLLVSFLGPVQLLTYYAGCTITCNRRSSSQTKPSCTTEQGNLPRQFATMWIGNTHCSNRLTDSSTTGWQYHPPGYPYK